MKHIEMFENYDPLNEKAQVQGKYYRMKYDTVDDAIVGDVEYQVMSQDVSVKKAIAEVATAYKKTEDEVKALLKKNQDKLDFKVK